MRPVRWLQGILITSLLAAAAPRQASAEPPLRVTLAGIFRTADTAARRSEVLEGEVIRRLRSLGLLVVAAPTSAGEACQGADCLPELARKVGAALAIIGVVYRTADLCTANLWAYDSRGAVASSADIHCQAETLEESLGSEFADQAGRFGEAAMASASALKLPQALPALSESTPTLASVGRRTREGRPLWLWDGRRKAVVYGLTVPLATLLGTAIAVSIFANIHGTDANGKEAGIDGLHGPVSALWATSALNAAALGVTLLVPATRR